MPRCMLRSPIKVAISNPVERQMGLLKAAFERDGV